MSSSSLEVKWSIFGKKILAVAVLWIFIFVPYLAFGVIILQFIFIVLALNEIKNINRQLNNPNLEEFYSKCLAGNIVKLIGLFVINVGGAMIAGVRFLRSFLNLFPGFWIFIPPIIVIIIGFIIMIIASSIEMRAWGIFKSYLQKNKEMFPDNVVKEVADGVDKLQSGTFAWALGFLFIPIVIGWILHIIGYFKLATFNKLVPKKEIKPTPTSIYQSVSIPVYQSVSTHDYQSNPNPVYRPIPASTPEKKDSFNFCPICGAKLDKVANFCAECGTHLKDYEY